MRSTEWSVKFELNSLSRACAPAGLAESTFAIGQFRSAGPLGTKSKSKRHHEFIKDVPMNKFQLERLPEKRAGFFSSQRTTGFVVRVCLIVRDCQSKSTSIRNSKNALENQPPKPSDI
jgi:hypothetical protein